MKKRITNALVALTIVTMTVGLATSAQAYCPWDVTGEWNIYSRSWQPDGVISYDESPHWWLNDYQVCATVYVDPGAYLDMFPRCDVDRSGEVELWEVIGIYERATYYGGSSSDICCIDTGQCPTGFFCNTSPSACGEAEPAFSSNYCEWIPSESYCSGASYGPMCGCDGNNYGSSCEAAVAGTSRDYRVPGRCPRNYEPPQVECDGPRDCPNGSYCANGICESLF